MSVSAAIEPVEADSTREAHALAFRIAFATAIGFTLGHLFFFNVTAPPEIYTLSLHDALPICCRGRCRSTCASRRASARARSSRPRASMPRSEEHTSELQSQSNLVCRLLL